MSKEKLFSFKVDSYDLEVVSFKGTQAISELYRYDIELISKDADIDFDEMLQAEVCLVLHNKDKEDSYIHGVLEHFEAYQKVDEYIYYRTALVPKLWWLSIAHHQQIFLDKKVPDILEDILRESRFTSSDYEFRLQESYNEREYVCQYKESRYDFMKRWMQRDGLYYYFEQDEYGSKLIITDAKEKQKKASVSEELFYRPVSGMQSYEEQVVSSIVYRSNNTIKSVHMKNFNYEKPSQDINSVKNSKGDDYTQTYMFGHNILTQDEVTKLTKINEERFKCQAKEMLGESNIISLGSGYIYSLKDYFRDDLNDDYLMVRVDAQGSQRGFLTAGFSDESDESSFYTNSFTMIPINTQFRDQVTVPWPHIGGMLSATVDGAGSGDTAELDEHGRYKVIMPFDISGRGDAKASAYLRMAQASAGEKQGIHFPLHKGTEVLIAFKGGDPDQPIITGAVPNINTPSPVNEDNVIKSIISTVGGNTIEMNDTPGKSRIHVSTADKSSSLTLRQSGSEGEEDEDTEGKWGTSLYSTDGVQFISADFENTIGGNKEEAVLGASEEFVVGASSEIKAGAALEVFAGAKADLTYGAVREFMRGGLSVCTPESKELAEKFEKIGEEQTDIIANMSAISDDVFITTNSLMQDIDILTTTIDRNIENIYSFVETFGRRLTTGEENIATFTTKTEKIDASIEKISSQTSSIKESMANIGSEIRKLDFSSTEADVMKSNAGVVTNTAEMFTLN